MHSTIEREVIFFAVIFFGVAERGIAEKCDFWVVSHTIFFWLFLVIFTSNYQYYQY